MQKYRCRANLRPGSYCFDCGGFRIPESCLPCPCCPCLPKMPDAPAADGNVAGAFFTSGSPFSLTAGSALPLTAANVYDAAISAEKGGVRIASEGTYFALYTAQVPVTPSVPVNTQLRLELNGVAVAGSERALHSSPNNATAFVAGQAVFRAGADSMLFLRTVSALNVSAADADSVTVSILRLS